MNALTALLIAIDVYLVYIVYRAARAWKEIWHFGPPMAVGLAAGLACIVLGQIAIVRKDETFVMLAEAAGAVCLLFVIWALWRRRRGAGRGRRRPPPRGLTGSGRVARRARDAPADARRPRPDARPPP